MKEIFKIVKAMILSVSLILVIAPKDANAVVSLSDTLSLTGFARYELGVHTAGKNPNLPKNHNLTLSRFFLQTEWEYQPSDSFEVYSNIRLTADSTYHWDNHLDQYNAFPVDVPSGEWTMMKTSDDDT